MKRKVLFTTDSEKFYGVILERLIRNEAALESLREQIILIRSHLDGSSVDDVRAEIDSHRDDSYDRLASSLIARLTLDQHEDPLSAIKKADQARPPS